MTIDEMKAVDVRTVDRKDLVDIRNVVIDSDDSVGIRDEVIDGDNSSNIHAMSIVRRAMHEKDYEQVPIYQKVALTVKEAAEYSNIGINRLESLLRTPRCPFVLFVGNKKLVKRKEFERFISESIEI